jgi:hypothetical protein
MSLLVSARLRPVEGGTYRCDARERVLQSVSRRELLGLVERQVSVVLGSSVADEDVGLGGEQANLLHRGRSDEPPAAGSTNECERPLYIVPSQKMWHGESTWVTVLPWNVMPSRSDEKPQRRSAWNPGTGIVPAPR